MLVFRVPITIFTSLIVTGVSSMSGSGEGSILMSRVVTLALRLNVDASLLLLLLLISGFWSKCALIELVISSMFSLKALMTSSYLLSTELIASDAHSIANSSFLSFS